MVSKSLLLSMWFAALGVPALKISMFGDGNPVALSSERYHMYEKIFADLNMFNEENYKLQLSAARNMPDHCMNSNRTAKIFNGIPKIIHYTWKARDFKTLNYERDWGAVNPDFKLCFWSDSDALDFMYRHAPEDEAMIRSMKAIQKFDYFRYQVLLHVGGVYNDVDVHPMKPIKHWGRRGSRLISGFEVRFPWDDHRGAELGFCGNEQLQQWTIAAAPGHPVLADVLDRIRRRHADNLTEDTLNYTGPCTWTETMLDHVGDLPEAVDFGTGSRNEINRRGVRVLSKERFAAKGWPTKRRYSEEFVDHGYIGSWRKQ